MVIMQRTITLTKNNNLNTQQSIRVCTASTPTKDNVSDNNATKSLNALNHKNHDKSYHHYLFI